MTKTPIRLSSQSAHSEDTSEPITMLVTLKNKRGLHARASAKFCTLASSFNADIRVIREGITVSACSIMGLLTLAAGYGDAITISANGEAAKPAIAALVELIESRFGEEE